MNWTQENLEITSIVVTRWEVVCHVKDCKGPRISEQYTTVSDAHRERMKHSRKYHKQHLRVVKEEQ